MKSDVHTHTPMPRTEWQVTQCACGHLTLRLGTIRLEFTEQEFVQLGRLVTEAMKCFELITSDATASYDTPLTH